MAAYPFLSDEWIEASRSLREAHRDDFAGKGVKAISVNLVVTQVPADVRSGESEVDAHLDTTSGQPEIDLGHLAKADISITADYALARSILIEGNAGKAMEAMQLGRLKVSGNMFKLMTLNSISKDPQAKDLAAAIQAITV